MNTFLQNNFSKPLFQKPLHLTKSLHVTDNFFTLQNQLQTLQNPYIGLIMKQINSLVEFLHNDFSKPLP